MKELKLLRPRWSQHQEVVHQHLGHRRQTVGCAGTDRDNVVLVLVIIIGVDAGDKSSIVFFGRSGNEDLLGASVDMLERKNPGAIILVFDTILVRRYTVSGPLFVGFTADITSQVADRTARIGITARSVTLVGAIAQSGCAQHTVALIITAGPFAG